MQNININFESKTIEMTKAFANKARKYGSPEYEEMLDACSAFPTYTLVTRTTTKKSSVAAKGLTYDFMERYITAHNPEFLDEFNILTGKAVGDKLAVSASYGEVRQWFLSKYDIFSRQRIDEILGKKIAA